MLPAWAAPKLVPQGQQVLRGADGDLRIGSHIQTQRTKAKVGKYDWYAGVVTGMPGSQVSILYDDGETWTGSPHEVWLLEAPAAVARTSSIRFSLTDMPQRASRQLSVSQQAS